MTKAEIDLYIEMKGVLAPFKGDWQEGDRYAIDVLPGDWRQEINQCTHTAYSRDRQGYVSVWLPLPIDPVNPKRGLWGMLGELITGIYPTPIEGWRVDILGGNTINSLYGATPTEALLRAIKAQGEGK